MGAWDRRFERQVERDLLAQKTRGVPESPQRPSPEGHGQPTSVAPAPAPNDRRAFIPPLGLREYWYPALPARKVGKRPVFWVMLGEELVFFRDKRGEVVALTDVCPHRGASLSDGSCFYNGFLTCAYHGATFDGRGECVAFISEGPDSRMVGDLRARTYPTRTLRGWVFVWMGEGEPAPIEEDTPPEFFEPETTVLLGDYTYWHTNWLLALENQSDAHNTLFVHRNSLLQLFGASPARSRNPIGPKSRVVNGRAVIAQWATQNPYAEEGRVPYQLYYPGVEGVWPLHRWRLLWTWFFKLFQKEIDYQSPEEWRRGFHLPAMIRTKGCSHGMRTRYAVPVTANLSRVVQFHCSRPRGWLGRLWEKLYYVALYKWLANYNFSGQDNGVASPCRAFTPEYLSATDTHVVAVRRLITKQSRDTLKRVAQQALSSPQDRKSPEAPLPLPVAR